MWCQAAGNNHKTAIQPITTPQTLRSSRFWTFARVGCAKLIPSSHNATMPKMASLGCNPNKWKRSPAARIAPTPLNKSRQAWATRSLKAMFAPPRNSQDTVSLAPVSAASAGVSVPRRDSPTTRETGIEQIRPQICPTRIGMPITTSVYAMNIFMTLSAVNDPKLSHHRRKLTWTRYQFSDYPAHPKLKGQRRLCLAAGAESNL